MAASAAPVSYERLPIGRPSLDRFVVPGAGGGTRPSRHADHGVDVVPELGSYFELTSFGSYLSESNAIR
jgi:hypothetical protein